MSTLFKCNNCAATQMPEEDVIHCVARQTLETPAEYEMQCPSCGSSDLSGIKELLCRGCDDVVVFEVDDYCNECIGDMTDARRDAMLDAMADDGPYGRIS